MVSAVGKVKNTDHFLRWGYRAYAGPQPHAGQDTELSSEPFLGSFPSFSSRPSPAILVPKLTDLTSPQKGTALFLVTVLTT